MAEPQTGIFDTVVFRLDSETNQLVPSISAIMFGYYQPISSDVRLRAVRAEERGGDQYYYIPIEIVNDIYPPDPQKETVDQIIKAVTDSPVTKSVGKALKKEYDRRFAKPSFPLLPPGVSSAIAKGASSFIEENITTTPIDVKTGLPITPALPSADGVVMDGTRPPASMISPRTAERRLDASSFKTIENGTFSNLSTADATNELYLIWDPNTKSPKAIDAEGFVNSRTIPGKEFTKDEIKLIAESLRGTVYLNENYDKFGPAQERIALREAIINVGKAITEANYAVLSAGVTDPSQYIDINDYIRNAKLRDAGTRGTTSTSVSLSGRGESDVYATNAAREYLGRNPTAKEKQKFLNALNAAERAAPTVTTTTPLTDGGSSTVRTTGGVSGELTAEEFMRRQPGAGSYQIAGNYFDAFIKAIGSPTRVPTPQ